MNETGGQYAVIIVEDKIVSGQLVTYVGIVI